LTKDNVRDNAELAFNVLVTAATDAKNASDTGPAKDATSAGLKTMNEKAVANAKIMTVDTDKKIADKEADIRRLSNNVTVLTHILALCQDKVDGAKAAKDAAKDVSDEAAK